MTYRNGNRNARNIYRVGPGGEEHIGCAFTEDDGRLIVLALRFAAQDLATMPPHPTCTDVSSLGQRHGTTWVCTAGCPRAEQPALCLTWIGGAAHCELRHGHGGECAPADSCTDEWQSPHRAGSRPNMCATCSEASAEPASTCEGCNRARRNPGRTCLRHGAVS
jgi:hypothetical protein